MYLTLCMESDRIECRGGFDEEVVEQIPTRLQLLMYRRVAYSFVICWWHLVMAHDVATF